MMQDHSAAPAPHVRTLVDAMITDACQTLGIRLGSFRQKIIAMLANKPANRLAVLLLELDRILARDGILAAAKAAHLHLAKILSSSPAPAYPKNGPLLVVSNHPGATDTLNAILAVERNDHMLVAGKRPMLAALPHIRRHLFFLNRDVTDRFSTLRAMIQSLKEGKTVVLFPRGILEPDPAIATGALKSIDLWSKSVGVLLSKVPETTVLPILSSHVVLPQIWHHWLVQSSFIKKSPYHKALIMQLAMQQLHKDPAWRQPTRLDYGQPCTAKELDATLNPDSLTQAVQQLMKDLMLSHFPQQLPA